MKRKLFLATIAVVMLAGCSNDETSSLQSKKVEDLEILTSIPSVTKTKGLKVGSAFLDGEGIKLAMKGDNGYSYKLSPYSYTGGEIKKWNAATIQDKFILLEGNLTACAVYPQDTEADITDVNTKAFDNWKVNLLANSTSLLAEDQKDYMWAAVKSINGQPINMYNGKVELDFYHALSRISFVLNKSLQYTGTGKVTKIILKKTGGFNAGNGLLYAWSGPSIQESVFTWNDPKVDQISCENATGVTLNSYSVDHSWNEVAHMLVAPIGVDGTHPNGLATGISIELTVDGKTMMGDLPDLQDNQGKSTFLNGRYYEYLIEIDPSGLIISPLVKVSDWVTTPTGEFEVK